ncbi:MAG: TlpA family protein disulfide reductase [Hyphomonadaceae bacterium]
MRLWALLAFAAIALGGVLYGLFFLLARPEAEGLARHARGTLRNLTVAERPVPATAHPFTDAEGQPRTLADFRGRVVVLNLWASWCAPCRREMPTLARLQREMGPRGVAVLAVTIDREGDRALARELLGEYSDGALPYYEDPRSAMGFAIGAPGLPTTLIIDREGREVARLAGGADWASPPAIALIEDVLADP